MKTVAKDMVKIVTCATCMIRFGDWIGFGVYVVLYSIYLVAWPSVCMLAGRVFGAQR